MEFAAWELTWVLDNKGTIKQFVDQEEEAQIQFIDGLIKSVFFSGLNDTDSQCIINKTTIFIKLLAKHSTSRESSTSFGIPRILIYNFWVGYLYQLVFSDGNRAQALELGIKSLVRFIVAIKKELKRDRQRNSGLLEVYRNYKHIIKNIAIKADREKERKIAIHLIKRQASNSKLEAILTTVSFNELDPRVLFLEAIKLVNLIRKELAVLSLKPNTQNANLPNKENTPHKMKVWRLNTNKDVEDVYLQNVNKRKMVNFDSEYYFKDKRGLKNAESFKSGKIFNAPNFTVEEAIDKEHNAALEAGLPHSCCDVAEAQQNKDKRSFYFEDREDDENENNKRKVQMEWDELKDRPRKGRGI
eukprot:GAHX01000057.1.p1 GENE.GAHX01000057.1~~GAHX01000057.1.p1  ORF type:complete len:358 (-),score=78.29 GAHX01000057.1:345-1418(-)